jgi:hypothetical protein
MLSVSLKGEVGRVVAAEWKGFAERRAQLAEVIDPALVVEQATASLADDAEFREAMEMVARGGATAAAMGEVVERFVRGWLMRLA